MNADQMRVGLEHVRESKKIDATRWKEQAEKAAERAEDLCLALADLILKIDAEAMGGFRPGFGPRLAEAVGAAQRVLESR